MSEKAFQSTAGGAPFPRTAQEWIDKGMAPDQAEHRMRQDVFGHDYATDAKGTPIERGRGSALQPTPQHLQAIQIGEDARRNRGMGWHPGMEGAFDPRMQAMIDAAVKAAMSGQKPKGKPGRKAKVAPPEATAT